MIKTLLSAAVLVTSLGLAPAFAGEGNGEPFPNNAGRVATHTYAFARPARDTGSAAYPDIRELPGSDLPRLAGNVLPSNGSEGPVQTANSLPAHFEEGTVAYAQATSVQNWMLAHARRTAPTFAAVNRSGSFGG